jgi:hypothetical protein
MMRTLRRLPLGSRGPHATITGALLCAGLVNSWRGIAPCGCEGASPMPISDRDRMLQVIGEAWERNPELRLVQLILNCVPANAQAYYMEDHVLEKRLTRLYLVLADHEVRH